MRLAIVIATAATMALALCATAAASTRSVRPSAVDGSRYVFRLGALRGEARSVVSARLVIGRQSRSIRRAVIRRAVRRGRIALHARRAHRKRVRLRVTVDLRPPSAPTGLTAGAGAGGVSLSWGAASDDTGVVAYRVVRAGRRIATLGASARSHVDTGVGAGTYSYAVRAVDRLGRISRSAAEAAATVPASGAVAPAAASGEGVPLGDLPGWRQIFADDFVTNVPVGRFPAAVSAQWGGYDGTRDTSRNGLYAPTRVVSIHDGLMDMHLHTEGGEPLVAAPMPKIPWGRLYGRYAVRFRADPLPGYKVAWLLWPDSENWPADGEIDFPETDLTGPMYAYMHRTGATDPSDQDWFATGATMTSWHTAVIEWTPGMVRFLLDGQVIGTSTSRVPSTAMHWVLQVETSLSTVPSAATDGHVLLDWVAVWVPA